MSGAIFSDINPATTSGNDLATLLNSFKDIIASGFSGTTRPVNLVAGGYWIDTTVSTAWLFKIFDGTDDITVYTINPTTNTVSIAGASGSFSLSQISADAVGPILSFLKKRIATNGQTLVGDSLGEAHFKSTDNTGAEITSVRLKVVSNNNTLSGQAGAYLVFEQINTNTGSLAEKIRITDGKIGVGTTSPQSSFHVKNSVADGTYLENEADSTASGTKTFKKRRVSGGGAVLSGDFLGITNYNTTDSAGVDYNVASLEISASENHTSANQGTKLELKVTGKLTNTKVAIMTFIDRLQFLLGFQTKHVIVGTNGTLASNAKFNRSAVGVLQLLLGNDSTAEGAVATTGFGQLGFLAETYTEGTKPTVGNAGRLIYTSDGKKVYLDDGSAWKGVGSGGGGGSLNWNDGVNPPAIEQDGALNQVRKYLFGQSQTIVAAIKVPSTYTPGSPITALIQAYSSASSNTFLIQSVSTLIRVGTDAITSTTNQRTSTNTALAQTAPLVNVPRNITLDLTSSTGQINGVAVSPNDIILVALQRGTDTATEDVALIPDTCELTT